MNNLINLISDIKNINQFGSSYSNLDSNRVIVNLMWINNDVNNFNNNNSNNNIKTVNHIFDKNKSDEFINILNMQM